MADINVNLNIYGVLTAYINSEMIGYANVRVSIPENITMRELLIRLGIPTQERGITFINGNLSALPGLQPDLEKTFKDNDRVAFFDLKSMWPFQYRHGVNMIEELSIEVDTNEAKSLHHDYFYKPSA